jgi:hypothetical protein
VSVLYVYVCVSVCVRASMSMGATGSPHAYRVQASELDASDRRSHFTVKVLAQGL